MKKAIKILAIVSLVIIISLIYWHKPRYFDGIARSKFRNDKVERITPDGLYPNPKITSGEYDTLNYEDLVAKYPCPFSSKKNNCTYSQAHRNVGIPERMQAFIDYGIKYPQPKGKYEVDHFIPLCMGGSNSQNNLWAQPRKNEWKEANYGFAEKDLLEAWVCKQIKQGELEPSEAYKRIKEDWVKYYLEIFPLLRNDANFGSINKEYLVGDDYED